MFLAERVAAAKAGHSGTLCIQLFSGQAHDVEQDVNEFLRASADDVILEDLGYNYQGDEYVDMVQVANSSSHGVCLLLRRK